MEPVILWFHFFCLKHPVPLSHLMCQVKSRQIGAETPIKPGIICLLTVSMGFLMQVCHFFHRLWWLLFAISLQQKAQIEWKLFGSLFLHFSLEYYLVLLFLQLSANECKTVFYTSLNITL